MLFMVNIVFVIGFIVLVVLLQRKLVRMKPNWIGWILPCICFAMSLLAVAGMIGFTKFSTTVVHDDEGNIIGEQVEQAESLGTDGILAAASVFILYNIPTVVFSVMCVTEHRKDNNKEQLHKMNIQDL